MPTTLKALARGAFGTSSTTLYTVPSSTTSVITNISVANTTGSSISFDILLDGIELFSNVSVNQYTTLVIDLKQVLTATKTITGFATTSGLKYHISGAEIA